MAKASLGKVNKTEAEKLRKQVESLQENSKNSPDALNELTAAQKAYDDGIFSLTQKQNNLVRNVKTQGKLVQSLEISKASGIADMDSFKALFYSTQHTTNSYKKGVSEKVATPADAYIKNATEKYQSRVYNSVKAMGRDEVTGKMNVTHSREVGEALFNLERGLSTPKVSKEAVEAATEIYEVSKFGSKEYQRLGGTIRSQHDNIMGLRAAPETLRSLAALDANFEETFVTHIMRLGVDVDHINATFGTKISSEAQLKTFLQGSYKAILSGGSIDKAGTLVPKEMKHLAVSNNISRGLRFTSAKSTLEFMEKYGAGNMYDHITGYTALRGIEDGAREAFGPSPMATKAAILDHIKQTAPELHTEALALFNRYADHLGITHAAGALTDADFHNVAATMKNIFRAALLGKVGLWQALIDMWNLPNLSNRMKGLPVIENIQSAYKELFKGVTISDVERTALAKRGFLLEQEMKELQDHLLTAADQGIVKRSVAYGTAGADAAVQKYTGGTRSIRATTEGAQKFLITTLSDLVEHGDINFHGEAQAKYLKSLGFDESVLKFIKENAFSEAHQYEHSFLAIDKKTLFNIDSDEGRGAALALTRVLMDHQQSINPTMPGAYQAALKQARKSGKTSRAVTESLSALSGYLSGYTMNMIQMANSMPGKSAKMKVLSTFVIASVISAYEATIINNLLNGKDIPPLSADLVGKVIGRSFGPIGDALVSGGDSVHGNILGNLIPGANFFLDVAGNTVGLGKDALTGDFKKMPARSAKILGKVMPGQTAPVFGLLFKRYINDQILAMTDPEAHRKFRGKEKQMKNTTGTQSWWKPGELTPGRAPDLSKMMSLHIDKTD
jgi:hypothetical protein